MRIRELISEDINTELIENVKLMKGPVGHWDKSTNQWVGQRYVGFIPHNILGNLNFEQHMQVLIQNPTKRDQLINWAKETNARDLVKKIEMALNGYSTQMIADEMYSNQQLDLNPIAAEKSVNVQLSQARKIKNIPIPQSSLLKYQSVTQQAVDLKRKLYRKNDPKRNSDRAVAQILHDRKAVDNITSVSALLSLLRKQLKDRKEPIPVWLEPSFTVKRK